MLTATRGLRPSAVLATLLSLGLLGCGAGASLTQTPPAQLPQSLPHQGEVPLETLLQELDALPAPAGMNAAAFGTLKQGLRAYLLDSGQAKFATKAVKGQRNIVHDLTFSTITDANDAQTDTITWSYLSTGDYDRNSEVNIADLSALGASFKATPASPDWLTKDRFADGDSNGEVNAADITPIGANLLAQVAGYRIESASADAGPWTAVGTVEFGDGVLAPSGQRMYEFTPPTPLAPFYRVVPLDGSNADGIPSDASRGFIVSPLAEIVGQAGGVQFVSRSGMSVVLQAPGTDPTSIAVGDVLVGDDGADGFLWRVLTVNQTGDQITVTGEPAGLSDLITKGVLDLSRLFNPDPPAAAGAKGGAAAKRASTPEELVLDCTQQTMALPEGMTFKVNHMLFKFAPDITIRITIDAEAYPDEPVRSFIMKIDTAYMDCDFDTALEGASYTGSFPATPYDPMYLHEMADYEFQFDELQNGIPFSATWFLKIHVGVRGTGDFQGDYPMLANTSYTGAVFGASWQPGRGWHDYNDFTSAYSDPDAAAPALASSASAPATMDWFVRGEVSAKLFGDDSRLTKLYFEPTTQMTTTPTATPVNGDDYSIEGWLGLDRDFQLGTYGGQDLDYASPFTQGAQAIDSGFVPRGTINRTISGTILDDGAAPVAGLTVHGEVTGTGAPLWFATTDASGDYTLQGISNGFDVTVVPEPGPSGYTFAPPTRQYIVSTNIMGADFVATPADGWTHSLGFNAQDDEIRSVAVDAAGNVYCAGYTTNLSGDMDALLVKYNEAGALQWAKSEGVSFTGGAQFRAVAVDASGIYTVGHYDNVNTFQQDILVMKWNPDGTVAWKQSWGLAAPATGQGVGLDTAGNVYVAGVCSQGLASGKEAIVLKFNSGGVVQWQRSFQGPNDDLVHQACYCRTTDDFLIVGHTPNATGTPSDDVSFLRVHNDGTLGAAQLYDFGGDGDVGMSITSDAGSHAYIAGASLPQAGGGSAAILLDVGFNGALLANQSWEVNDPSATYHYFNGILLGDDGLLYTGGYWQSGIGGPINATLAQWNPVLLAPQASELFASPGGDTRLGGLAWSPSDNKLVTGGYCTDATGSWSSGNATIISPSPTLNTYGGSLVAVTGTLNPDSPFTGTPFPIEDTGDGLLDAFVNKRSAP